jgi:hypothetical protein
MHAVAKSFATSTAGLEPFVADIPEEPSDLEPPEPATFDDQSWEVFLDDDELEPLPERGDFWPV